MEEKKPNEEQENLNPEDFDENGKADSDIGDDDETSKDDGSSKEKSQSDEEKEKEKAKNAHYAQLRREKEAKEKAEKEREQREREQKIRAEAKLEAELGVLKVNPYTEQPITDEEDLKIYKLQKSLEDEGRDPIADLPRKIAEENRRQRKLIEDEKAKQQQAEIDNQKKIDAEIKELREKYPKVDTSELAKDELFQECLKGRAGRWSQVEIYELYQSKKAEIAKKEAEEKSKNTVDEATKKLTKTPSSKSSGKITAQDVANMSDEEFKKYWDEKYK